MEGRAGRSRNGAAVQAATAKPRSTDLLGRLLDETVLSLLDNGRSPTTEALAVAGRVVKDTPWRGYRSGRTRLATMAASYLRWLAPPESWSFTGSIDVAARRVMTWTAPDGIRLADLLDVGENAGFGPFEELFDGGDVDRLAGVRVLRVGAPTTSLLYTGPNRHESLVESAYWFEPANNGEVM